MPKLLERLAQIGAPDRLVVRQEHRDQACVGSALHVVLSTQRMQAGAGTADLPGDQGERDQAARIVGAVHMLADAHAPEDDGSTRARIHPRHFAQGFGRNAADRLHLLRGEFLDALLEFIEALGIAGDILFVGQAFGDDGIDHRVQHRDIAAGLERQMLGGMARQRLPARVHHDQLGAALGRVLDEGRSHRVIDRRIGADHDDDFGVHRGRERRRHCAGIQAFHQGCDRRGVAQPGAVIDIVGAEAGAHQLLEQIRLFVGALGRTETGERFHALLVANLDQAPGRDIERLFPGSFAEMREGIGRIDLVVGVLPGIWQPHQRFC